MQENNHYQDSDHVRSAVMTFFLGALVGSSLSLLFAPTSGRRLRRNIKRKGDRLRLSAANSVSTLRDRGEDIAEKIGDVLEDTSEGLRQATRVVGKR
jgi:gas vesicle protein